MLKIVAGVIAIALGLVEIVFPGPAIVFLVAGGALLATQSRHVARFMDWSEVHGRRWLARVRALWCGWSFAVRMAIATVLVAFGAATAVAFYRVMTD